GAVAQVQRRAGVLLKTAAAEAAARAGDIVADGAVAECQAALVVNAASSRTDTQSVGDGQPGDGRVRREIMEYPKGSVAIDRKIGCAGAIDSHVMRDRKFAAGEQDRAGTACGVDGVAVRRACEAGAERAGAAVRSAGDGAGVRLYGDCCGEKERRGNKRRRASTGRAVKGGFKRGKSFHLTKP